MLVEICGLVTSVTTALRSERKKCMSKGIELNNQNSLDDDARLVAVWAIY